MKSYDDLAAYSPTAPPRAHGIYAWWQSPGALPGVPGVPHPSEDLELLYVGIGPVSASSKSNLRKRLSKHHRGAIGSSTFRFALTAFLWRVEKWELGWTDRPVLSDEGLAELALWQRGHLGVQWFTVEKPWNIEAEVMKLMRPPLNSEGNHSHPFFNQLDNARSRLREASKTSAPG